MVRKMLKALIKVTADKTHFTIDIKILIILVYHFILRYNPPEYNIKSYTTSFFSQFTIAVPHTSYSIICFTTHQSIN